MNLQLTLPNEVGTRLVLEAQKRGSTVDHLVAHFIEKALSVSEKTLAVVTLLQEWAIEDDKLSEEQIDRHRAVLQAFDDDRPSDRKLYNFL